MSVVSVIIPMYNSEKTIINCLESLRAQSYKNFEVILINDGSKDNSLSLVEDFKRDNDLNISVHTKQNGGVSSARNIGIQFARGEFLVFIDADDSVSTEHLSSLLSGILENPNLPVLACNQIDDISGRVKEINVFGIFCYDRIHIAYEELERTNQLGYLHNKIFYKDIILKKNILFPNEVHMAEDLLFVMAYLCHISCIIISPSKTYVYNRTVNSLSEKKQENKQILKYLELLSLSYKNISKASYFNEDFKESLEKNFSAKVCTCLMSIYIQKLCVNKIDLDLYVKVRLSLGKGAFWKLKNINKLKYVLFFLPMCISGKVFKFLYKKKFSHLSSV